MSVINKKQRKHGCKSVSVVFCDLYTGISHKNRVSYKIGYFFYKVEYFFFLRY